MAADEGKRRIAAILAADVAGYSRLMADDERATVRTLTACREVFAERIEAREGRVVDTAGDSVLAVFDSVVEAVEAAAPIQPQQAEPEDTDTDTGTVGQVDAASDWGSDVTDWVVGEAAPPRLQPQPQQQQQPQAQCADGARRYQRGG